MIPTGVPIDGSMPLVGLVLLAVAALASVDLVLRVRHRPTHYLFAAAVGTIISLGIIQAARYFLQPDVAGNAYAMAAGCVLVILGWKVLFGPWETHAKAAMLGTFIFWVTLYRISHQSAENQYLYVLAILVGLIPAAVWCTLFLKYHSERMSSVLLMFFSGMLSTAPILFYDALARQGVELQFFLFRIVPESFNQTSESFVSGQLGGLIPVNASILISFLTFLFVGLIEEVSKYWMVRRNAERLITSIDDAIQMSIIVAIGFAFAENVINPSYFMAFTRDYLLSPASPDFVGFLSNVIGRSILTSMVHIVSTGVLGYFLGKSLFAASYIAEEETEGKRYLTLDAVAGFLNAPRESIYRSAMLVTGIVVAVGLHTVFNFMVTLPDLLPGNPQSLGAVLGLPGVLDMIPMLLIPSLLYVVGGFWLLTNLFMRKENTEERGRVVHMDALVRERAA